MFSVYITSFPSTMNNRIQRLKEAVQSAVPGICPERALLWTDYFKNRADRTKPMVVQIAEAVRHVPANESIAIYPDEIVAGNYISRRVGGIIYPESHGLNALAEIFKFHKRPVNPLDTRPADRWKLAAIIPFWLTRCIPWQAFDSAGKRLAFLRGQVKADQYQIYETGGIAHLTPNHEKILSIGLEGFIKEIQAYREKAEIPEQRHFYQAAEIAAAGLMAFAERYAALARSLARTESDPERKADLARIAEACKRVPRYGAQPFTPRR